MDLNQAMKVALKANELSNNVLSGLEIGSSMKNKVVAGFFNLTREHFNSTILLIEKNFPASVSALQRPLLEAMFRGTWFATNGTEKDAEDFNEGKPFNKITANMSKEIDDVLGKETFQNTFKNVKDMLHDYTHGGMMQIGRMFNEDQISTNFTDEEKVEILIGATANFSLSLLSLAYLLENEDIKTASEEIILMI